MNHRIRTMYLIVGLMLVFPLVISAQQKHLTEIDLDVNGVRSGSTYRTVLRKLGKPMSRTQTGYKADEACSGSTETHITLKYSGLEVSLIGDGSGKHMAVYALEITSKKWNGSGAKIRDTISSIKKRFGKPNSTYNSGRETIVNYVTKDNLGGVNFYFHNKRLIRILMTETLC